MFLYAFARFRSAPTLRSGALIGARFGCGTGLYGGGRFAGFGLNAPGEPRFGLKAGGRLFFLVGGPPPPGMLRAIRYPIGLLYVPAPLLPTARQRLGIVMRARFSAAAVSLLSEPPLRIS